MARDARLALADMRAMEEQKERTNPLSGRRMLNRTQFPKSTDEEPYPMSGSGATPSMGLSQFRGGAKEVGRKLGQILREKKGAAYHKEFMEGCGDLMITHKDESSSEECAPCGAGTKKGQTRKTARKAFEGVEGGMGTGRYEGHGKEKSGCGAGDKRKARGALVSKLMKEKGMSLAEASKHIKEHKLL